MIEIYDIQDIQEEKKPLDITPELAVMAARVLKEWCGKANVKCKVDGARCPFFKHHKEKGIKCLVSCENLPFEWELPERENKDGEERKV